MAQSDTRRILPHGLRAHLQNLPKEVLVDFLAEVAEADEGIRERLCSPTGEATPAPSHQVDVDELERSVRIAIQIEGYIDYRGASMYAMQVEEALDVIEQLLRNDRSSHALRLVETAIKTLSAAMNNVDESGELHDALKQLKSLHVRACEAADVPAKELARKLFDAELGDGWGLFYEGRDGYAHLLGEDGSQEFERLVREAWTALPMLGPNQTDKDSLSRRFNITAMMRGLAGGNDERIEVLKKDLSKPSSFEQIARLILANGQTERALEWVQRGLKAFPRRDPKLVQLARDIYKRLGRDEDLSQLAFDDFVEALDMASYRALRDGCTPQQSAAWRERALDHVRQQLGLSLRARMRKRWPKLADGTLIVEILLVEGDVDAARREATTYGCAKEVMARFGGV